MTSKDQSNAQAPQDHGAPDNEQEEIARLMRTLRDSIHFEDDPEPPPKVGTVASESSPRFVEPADSRGRVSYPADPSEPEARPTQGNEDFQHFLATLRQSISEHAEETPEPRKKEVPQQSLTTTVPSELHESPSVTLDKPSGDSAAIASFLRSLHDIPPTHSATHTGQSDESPIGDEDADLDRRDRWQGWKIAVVLGSAALLGLVIALVNPLSDTTPPSPVSRVVVPEVPPPAPREPVMAVIPSPPVIVPAIPTPAPVPAPTRLAESTPLPSPPLMEEPPRPPAPPAPLVTVAPPEPVQPPPPTPAPPPETVVTAKPPAVLPRPAGPLVFTIQMGSFRTVEYANTLIKRLKDEGYDAWGFDWTNASGQVWHVVRVGRIAAKSEASKLAHQMASQTGLEVEVLLVH